MTEPRVIAVVHDYLSLIAALRARVRELGISYATFDEIAGWGDGNASKTLCEDPPEPRGENGARTTKRGLGPMAFDAALGTAAIRLVVVEDEKALEKLKKRRDFVPAQKRRRTNATHGYVVQRITREHLRSIGALGGMARVRKMTPKQRSRSARKASRARWRKWRMSRVKNRSGE